MNVEIINSNPYLNGDDNKIINDLNKNFNTEFKDLLKDKNTETKLTNENQFIKSNNVSSLSIKDS